MDATKHIYRVGRAADHQNATDMENYENRPLNKSVTAIISQHSYLEVYNYVYNWQNWTQNWYVERSKGIICKAEYFCTAAVSY